MTKLLTLVALLTLAACSEVPTQLHEKLLCLNETGEAYVATRNIGDTMFIRRQEFADPICKEKK